MDGGVTLWVSSVTGNTAKIAEGVRATLEELGWRVNEAKIGVEPEDEVVIACFWCRKSTLDPKSSAYLKLCSGKKMLLLGTFGGFPSGKYAQLVRDNVVKAVTERNTCLGVFLCQGKVRAQRIEERRALPESDPHHLDDWGVARLEEGQKHPNDTDVLYAQAFVRDYLPALQGGASSAKGPEVQAEEGFALSSTSYGAGEPLVLLHGNGEESGYFEHQIEHFKDSFEVIAVDTRGHGGSPRGSAPFTLDQFVEDLAGFFDAHDIEAAHLLGFSDGANVAILFALKYPQRVLSLVLNGANLFPEGLVDEVRREDAANWEIARAEGDERALELLALMMNEPHIDPAKLSAFDMPVLVVAGTDDMIKEEHTRLIAESIPGAELNLLEGGHFVAAEDPAAFNQAVESFLSGLDG